MQCVWKPRSNRTRCLLQIREEAEKEGNYNSSIGYWIFCRLIYRGSSLVGPQEEKGTQYVKNMYMCKNKFILFSAKHSFFLGTKSSNSVY